VGGWVCNYSWTRACNAWQHWKSNCVSAVRAFLLLIATPRPSDREGDRDRERERERERERDPAHSFQLGPQ
jgi:hypothetical protein